MARIYKMIAECNKYVFIFSDKRVNFPNLNTPHGDNESALSSFQTLYRRFLK